MKVKHKSSTLQQYLSSTLASTQLRSFDHQFAEALQLCAPASSYTGFCASIRIALPLFRALNPLVSEFPISIARLAVPSLIQALIASSYEFQKGLPHLIAVSGRMQALNQHRTTALFHGTLLNNCNLLKCFFADVPTPPHSLVYYTSQLQEGIIPVLRHSQHTCPDSC
jgi:hypothetical protein